MKVKTQVNPEMKDQSVYLEDSTDLGDTTEEDFPDLENTTEEDSPDLEDTVDLKEDLKELKV